MSKITGFHVGPGGNPTGIGNYIQALDDAGRPALVMSADVTTGLADIFNAWDEGSTVPHLGLYRVVKDGSEYYAVPNYILSPESAATDYYNRIVSEIPPEVASYKDRVWICIGNELDKNRADWIGEWLYYSAIAWNAAGYKICGPGWASGEPEPEHWETPGMLRYLSFCGENPHLAAIAVHEYSYDVNNIENGIGWLIGRYRFIHQACDNHGIPHPKIFITEWGWENENVPTPSEGINDIATVHNRYDDYPPHAVWYLGGGYGDIAQDAQGLIAPTTDYLLSLPEPEPMPEYNPLMITVSHHQGDMDWRAAKDAGVDVALIRLSYGNTKDSRAEENFAGAAAAGILRQPFHYLELGDGAPPWHVQARLFYTWANQLETRCELPSVVDVEDPNVAGNAFAKLRIFVALYYGLARESNRAAGVLPPEIYTRASYWNEHLGDRWWWSNFYPLHVAHFGVEDPTLPIGWRDYQWHQYSCGARGADYGASSTNICLSRFGGTREDFHHYYRIPPEGLSRDGFIYWKAKQLQQVSVNRDAALQRAAAEDGYFLVGSEGRGRHGDTRYAIQPFSGVASGGFRAYAAVEGDWGNVFYVEENGDSAFALSSPVEGIPLYITSDWRTYREYNGVPYEHEGIDLRAVDANGSPVDILAAADGVVSYVRGYDPGGGYGIYVKLRHDVGGERYYTWYAHLSAVDPAILNGDGLAVSAGQRIGRAGDSGNSTGVHLHFGLEWIGHRADGNFIQGDWVDPKSFLGLSPSEPDPEPGRLDLLPYIRGDGRAYMVQHSSGASEKFRVERDDPWFYLVKNAQWEQFVVGDGYIWRRRDTSPGPAPDYAERPGELRFYDQFEANNSAARWCPQFMAVGEVWEGPGHWVQFYYKSDCGESAANSGPATNRIKLVARHDEKEWNGITVNDVIELRGVDASGNVSGEGMFFARDFGLVAWEADWGQSAIVELNVEPDNVRETLDC